MNGQKRVPQENYSKQSVICLCQNVIQSDLFERPLIWPLFWPIDKLLDINEMKHQRLRAVPFISVVLSERCTRRCNSPPGGATRVVFVSVAPSERHLPVQYDTYNLPRVYSQAGRPWEGRFTVESVLSKFNYGRSLELNLAYLEVLLPKFRSSYELKKDSTLPSPPKMGYAPILE